LKTVTNFVKCLSGSEIIVILYQLLSCIMFTDDDVFITL